MCCYSNHSDVLPERKEALMELSASSNAVQERLIAQRTSTRAWAEALKGEKALQTFQYRRRPPRKRRTY